MVEAQGSKKNIEEVQHVSQYIFATFVGAIGRYLDPGYAQDAALYCCCLSHSLCHYRFSSIIGGRVQGAKDSRGEGDIIFPPHLHHLPKGVGKNEIMNWRGE